jgi:Spy/CpxP family protein refolding chaperone
MKMKTIFFTVALASTGIARAANTPPMVDLNTLQASPLEILQGLAPQAQTQTQTQGAVTDPKKPAETPQACKDAAITPEQKAKIDDAVYQAMREKVQLDANLKMAFMTYGHIVMDPKSDMAAAQAASTQVTDSVSKMAAAHMNLGTHILYEIVTPEQRAKTFECMVALHKMCKDKKK